MWKTSDEKKEQRNEMRSSHEELNLKDYDSFKISIFDLKVVGQITSHGAILLILDKMRRYVYI